MKRFFTLAGILAATALLSTSCKDTTTPGPGPDPTKDGAVSFTSAISSRASGNQFEAGDEISVTALKGEEFAKENVKYSFVADKFTSTTPIELAEGEKLSYRAVYPFVEVAQDGSLSVSVLENQSEGTNYTKSDLMSSFVEETSSTTPKLTFDHLLSKVVINVVSSDVATDGAVAVVNAKKDVDFNILTKACVSSGDVAAITMAADGAAAFKAIVAPQTFAAGVFATVTIGSEVYELAFDEEREMKPGKKYEFDITIAAGGVTFEEDINDWEDGNTDEPDQPATDNEIESVTIAENELESLILDVKVAEDFDGTYALFFIGAADYESYPGGLEQYAFDFIADDIATYGTDYTVADDMYVFQGDVEGFNFLDAWNLTQNAKFRIVAVGADANGDLTTAVTVSEEFTVKGAIDPDDIDFPDTEFGALEITESKPTSITYTVTPVDKEMGYLLFVMTKDNFESFETDVDVFLNDFAYLGNLFTQYGYTMEEGLPLVLKAGDDINFVDQLDPETEYVVYAYGVDPATQKPITKLTTAEVTTTAPEAVEGQLASITVSDITSDNAVATIDAGDFTGCYYVVSYPMEIITGDFGGDVNAFLEAMLYTEVDYYGTDLSVVDDTYVFQGDAQYNIGEAWMLEPNTEQLIVAVGVDVTGAMTCEPVQATFTTSEATDEGGDVVPPFVVPTEVEFPDVDFGTLEIASTGATEVSVNIFPNDKEMNYILFIASKDNVDDFATDEDLILDDFSFFQYMADSYGLDYLYVVENLSYIGDMPDAFFEDLDPATEYVCYAYGIDVTTSLPLTKIVRVDTATEDGAAGVQGAMSLEAKPVRHSVVDLGNLPRAQREIKVLTQQNSAKAPVYFTNMEAKLTSGKPAAIKVNGKKF